MELEILGLEGNDIKSPSLTLMYLSILAILFFSESLCKSEEVRLRMARRGTTAVLLVTIVEPSHYLYCVLDRGPDLVFCIF